MQPTDNIPLLIGGIIVGLLFISLFVFYANKLLQSGKLQEALIKIVI